METEIGNVTLGTIIEMLQDGWKIKDFIYRGVDWAYKGPERVPTQIPGGDPMWITSKIPNLVVQTAWFEGVKDGVIMKDRAPRRLGGPYFATGFNKVVFTREDEVK